MKKRHSVLLVSSNFPPVIGGSAVVYDQLCRNAPDQIVALGSARNHDTGVPFKGLAEFDAACPYVMYRRPYLRPPSTAKRSGAHGRLLSFLLDDIPVMLGTLACIARIIVRHRIKVVCLGDLVSNGWLVFPLRYLLRRHVIFYTHGEEVSQQSDSMLARLRRRFLHHANAIVAVSLFCKSQIVSMYGIDARRIAVVSNGVNLEMFSRGAADPGILPEAVRGHPAVLSVSRLVERKGQEKLIRAFPAVLAAVPDAYCLIVGTGPLAQYLRTVAESLGLSGRIIFLGGVEQDQLVRLYRTCDVFALPCRTLPDGDTEGFGLVFLEANACGLPVVAGAAGGTVEAVIDGETGFLVDGNETQQIADAVIRLLVDKPLRERLSEAGWRHAQNTSWGGVTRDFLALCHDQHRNVAIEKTYPSPRARAPLTAIARSTAAPALLSPRLLVTIDVEEEFVWTRFSRDYAVRGVESLASYHAECRALGISPVFLVSYPMLIDPHYSRFFEQVLNEGSAEVGIHIHAWTTPPYWEHPNSFNSFQCNLPPHIERRKIELMCRTYEERFGRAVNIHRAGRWGGSQQTGRILADVGIDIDLSPSTGYAQPGTGAPDFSTLDGWPFWTGPQQEVLALPATAINFQRGPHWVSSGAFALRNYIPNFRKFGKPVRFSPEGQSADLLASMAHQIRLSDIPVAIHTLHSTSLYANGNPYSATAGMTAELRATALAVLKNCVETELFVPTTCEEIWQAAGGASKQRVQKAA